jgi:glycosyltransferase involved in cell wall biosynthesis
VAEQFSQLCRAKPDVVHTQGHPALLAAAVLYRTLIHRSARLVFTQHIEPVEPGRWWSRLALGAMLTSCSSVTVFSRTSVQTLGLISTPAPSAERVHVIEAAAECPRGRTRTDPEVRSFADRIGYRGGPFLLQVSNFAFQQKVAGALLLLEAVARVRERYPTVQLLLVGGGRLTSRVEAYRDQLGLSGSVIMLGRFIEDLSLPIALADIHCHISKQDASPISVMEAMHAGKPIVASRVGGVPELIDHGTTGILVEDDPGKIAAAIVELLEHPEQASAIARRAQQVAATRFTWERAADDFTRLYGVVRPASLAVARPMRSVS